MSHSIENIHSTGIGALILLPEMNSLIGYVSRRYDSDLLKRKSVNELWLKKSIDWHY